MYWQFINLILNTHILKFNRIFWYAQFFFCLLNIRNIFFIIIIFNKVRWGSLKFYKYNYKFSNDTRWTSADDEQTENKDQKDIPGRSYLSPRDFALRLIVHISQAWVPSSSSMPTASLLPDYRNAINHWLFSNLAEDLFRLT